MVATKEQQQKEGEGQKKKNTSNKRLRNGKNKNQKIQCKRCGSYHLGKYCLKDNKDDLLKGGKSATKKNGNKENKWEKM